jgi:hypothetical protein
MTHFHALNFLPIIAATIVYFMLGAVWYSPVLFSKSWSALQPEDAMKDKSNLPILLSMTFVLNFVIAIAMALLVALTNTATIIGGAKLGLLTGVGFSATTMGINSLYAKRSFKLFLIDGAYHIISFCLMGALLAVWH